MLTVFVCGQPISLKEIRLANAVKLKETLEVVEYAETGYFVDVDMNYTYGIAGETKTFQFIHRKKTRLFSQNMCFS